MRAANILIAIGIAAMISSASARISRHGNGGSESGGLPELNVKGSCMDAQKFSTGLDRNSAFKGCMQDEMAAKDTLKKRWSAFKGKERSNCVEQSRDPSPSYVEVLTCLEMNTDAISNAPRVDGKAVPQIGGPVAPGLSSGQVPTTSAPK